MTGERLNDNVPPNTQTKERKSGFGVKQWRLDEFDLDTKGSMQKHKQQSKARDDQTVVPISNERLFLTNMYNGTLSASDVELYSLQLEIHKRLVSVSQLANPLSDHLLYLVNYNAFRGLFLNKVTLSKLTDHLVVGSDRTYKLDIMMGLKQDAVCIALGHNMPPHLQPTALQSSIAHANWIDFIPFPRMRDNLIIYQDQFNHRLFIKDVMGNVLEDVLFNKYGEGTGPIGRRLEFTGKPSDYASDRRGIIIWGEPHRMESWEVTSGFLQRWGWAVEGCHELMRVTNQWRALRGEGPLIFESKMPKQWRICLDSISSS